MGYWDEKYLRKELSELEKFLCLFKVYVERFTNLGRFYIYLLQCLWRILPKE